MTSTPPLPVEIVESPPADLLLELFSGLVGAVVAAVVSALVAVYVVRRTHRGERGLARELASYAAAESLMSATWDLLDALESVRGRYDTDSVKERRRAYRLFARRLSLNEPALKGYRSLDSEYALLSAVHDLAVAFEEISDLSEGSGMSVVDGELTREAEGQLFGSVFVRVKEVVASLGEYRSTETGQASRRDPGPLRDTIVN